MVWCLDSVVGDWVACSFVYVYVGVRILNLFGDDIFVF